MNFGEFSKKIQNVTILNGHDGIRRIDGMAFLDNRT